MNCTKKRKMEKNEKIKWIIALVFLLYLSAVSIYQQTKCGWTLSHLELLKLMPKNATLEFIDCNREFVANGQVYKK